MTLIIRFSFGQHVLHKKRAQTIKNFCPWHEQIFSVPKWPPKHVTQKIVLVNFWQIFIENDQLQLGLKKLQFNEDINTYVIFSQVCQKAKKSNPHCYCTKSKKYTADVVIANVLEKM